MSSIDPLPEPLPYGRPSAGARLREKASRIVRMRSFWALADQGIASASNFITGWVLFRSLDTKTFGGYSLLWELLLFLVSLHAAVIAYPLIVRGTKLDLDRLRHLTTVGLIFTVVVSVPLGLGMFGMGAWQGEAWEGLWIAIFAATAISAFLFHETLRRALMSHFLYTELIWGDAVAYLGMTAIVVSLAQFRMLSVASVFATLTLTFALGALVQWSRLKPLPAQRNEVKPVMQEFWVLGKWMLASNLTLLLTTVGVQWLLAFFQNLTQVAQASAVIFMIKVTNPMISAMCGLIVPAVAREGNARAGMKYLLLGTAILAPYFLVLLIAPDWSTRMIVGNNPEYLGHALEVRAAVIGCLTGFLGAAVLAMLMGLGLSKANFYAQVVNSIASVGIVMPAAIYWGWTGAIVAGTIASLLTCIMAVILLLRAAPHHPAHTG